MMRQLDPHDLNWALRLLPRQVKELMEAHSEIILGGGFIRSAVQGERPNDIDLFVPSEALARQYAQELAGNKKFLETGNAYSVSKVGGHFVQFVHRWTYSNPRALLESFDFTIACAAVWYAEYCQHQDSVVTTQMGNICTRCLLCDPLKEIRQGGCWLSEVDDNFYSDLAAKRLVYRSPQRNEDAGGSFLRLLKFYHRGFRSPLDSLGGIIARLVGGIDEDKLTGFIEDQGMTREQGRTRILTSLLVEVDPAADPAHIAHLPSLREDARADV
jgi:hypothetical protein